LKNRNKKILIILILLAQTIFAQASFEFDVHYGFGASELTFNSVPGLAISIYPIRNFGFSAGLQYSWRWQSKANAIIDSTNTIDSEEDPFIFRYSIDKYKEKLSGKIWQVPLLLKYSNDLYYIAAGVKIGTVQKASVSIDSSGLKTEGYYPQYNLTLSAPAYQGFGTQSYSASKIEISSKNLTMLAIEGGLKLKLGNNFAILTGIFADYSFNKGFNRNLKPTIERVEDKNSNVVSLVANDRWKSWQPWSIGAVVKFSLATGHKNTPPEETFVEQVEDSAKNHNITVKTNIPPPPIPVQPSQKQSNSIVPDLPKFLLNREADFVFHYPETNTSPTDSTHLALISQIANALREKPSSQLHCVGYSEKLLDESVAYETAFQRVLRIRFTLSRFFGIEERRISIYSQGSKNIGYRRTECFVIDTLP